VGKQPVCAKSRLGKAALDCGAMPQNAAGSGVEWNEQGISPSMA